jgi:fatty acid desaturase
MDPPGKFTDTTGGEPMSARDTRKQFDDIVGHLAAEDPALARPVRMIPRRVLLTVLTVVGALIWAGLSVLMVVWGAAGVVLTCVVVATAIGVGVVRAHQYQER